MDDDIDIYADLSITETKKEPVQIVAQNVELEKKFLDLENEVKALRLENEVLNRNISSLLKTAQAEISRKDNVIAELRKQLDNVAFRRGKFQTNPNRNFSNNRGERTSHSNNIKQETHANKKVAPEYTEYLCHSHSHGEDNSRQPNQEETFKKRAPRVTENRSSDDEDEKNQKYDSSKVYNTLYGDRLRKKLIAEDEEQRKAKEEHRLKDDERKQEDEKQRKKEEDERRLKEELRKQEDEKQRRKEEEERRLKEEEDRRRENEKQRRRDEERRLKDEERRYDEEKQRRKEEEKRYREEQLKKKEREERKMEEEKRVREAYQRKKDDERWKRDEEKRLRDDYQRKKDNERRKKDEEKRGREEHPRKKDDEWRKKDEERRYKEEQKKREEERNSQEIKVKEVQRKRDEERRRREEERKAREEERKMREEERKAREEEQRIQDEERKLKEEKARLEKMIREEDRQQRIAQQIAEVARIRSIELEEQRKKVLENEENHRLSRWPDVQESAESRKAQSVSPEEYAARLMRLNLKRGVDYSNQRRTNQDADFRESQHSDKDAPHDPRRMKKTETDDRRRKNSGPGNRSRSPENLRNKRFSPERCENDFARNKPHSNYSSRYPNHNNENSRYGPQSHSQKNDYHCRNDRLPDQRRNCKDRNWPEVVQERYGEDRKRKCGSLDRDSHHISKKHRLEDEMRNDSEGERCTQKVVVDEIESPDELEDGEIASVEANEINLHNKHSSWDLENEQKHTVAEDEESLEKIEQQLQEYNETKNVNHVPLELPEEKFTDTQLKNVLETSFELESPGKARKSSRSKFRSHSRSQSRSQSRDKEDTKKEQNLNSKDELELKNTVEPMVVDQEDNTKPVDEYVSSDTQKQLNTALGALNQETELEKLLKTEQSGCDKSGDLEIKEDETETKVEADKMEEETKDENCDEVLKLKDEMKSSNPEIRVPDHRPEVILSEPETTPIKNHQLPSLTTSTPVGNDAVVDPHKKSDDIKDSEPLDLNIKLEISISPAKKSTPDKNYDPSEEDKTTSDGTVESDSKDETTTSDETSSSSSSEMDEDKSPGLPQLNLSESDAEEPQDNAPSEIVSQPVTDGASTMANKNEEETNQVPQDNPVTETSKESSEGSTKLDDKMYELFGSEQSNGPSAMFSPVMEVEVETSDTVDSPGKKLEDIKEEGETEETEDEELIDMPEPEDKSSVKPQTTSILGSLLQCDEIIKFSRFSTDEIKLGIKLERSDQTVWSNATTGGSVAERPNTFGAFRRRKKVVVSVGKVKKGNTKDTKIQNLLDRKEDKVRQTIEDLIDDKSNPGTTLKKEAVAKKVTVKTEKKGPIVFKRRRPKHLSDSSSCFTVD